MLQREHYYRLPRSRSYNGELRKKPNKQKKPVPEMTPGRALLCLWKPKSLVYQGFQAKRKCTVILSKLPCIGGISTVHGYNAPCFESVVHDLRRWLVTYGDNRDRKDRSVTIIPNFRDSHPSSVFPRLLNNRLASHYPYIQILTSYSLCAII